MISEQHVMTVCKLGEGKKTCSFLMLSGKGFECAKKTAFEKILQERRVAGTMTAQGDNCEGPPGFTVKTG